MKHFKQFRSKSKSKSRGSFDRPRPDRKIRYLGDDEAILDEEEDEHPPVFSADFEDETADIDANEMTARLFKNVTHANKASQVNSVSSKIASAYVSTKSSSSNRRARRQSSNKPELPTEAVAAAEGEEEDGWISVGPKHHHSNHRKSFNHDEAQRHRKKFHDSNRQARSSFSKSSAPASKLIRPVSSTSSNTTNGTKSSDESTKVESSNESAIEDDVDDGEWETPKKTVRVQNVH